MGFSSQIYPDEQVITDSTPVETPDPAVAGRGLILSRPSEGYAYGGIAEPFPAALLIPESEWQARIQEQEERKTRLSDVAIRNNLPHKDQNGTNYCWINAPTHCVELNRLVQNQTMVILSPASCGAPIKNFKNDGGWGKEGLDYIVKHGLVPVEKWPANAIDRKYWTEANKAIALDYRVTEWMELRPRNKAEMISLLLHRIPGASGLNWWRHEVTYYDAVWLDGTAAVRFRNSWAGYGDNGFSILQGTKMLADDLVAPRVAMAA